MKQAVFLSLSVLGFFSLRFPVAAAPVHSTQGEPPALSVSIAVPKENGQRVIRLSTADPHFDVVIRNVSRQPLDVFGEDNSEGYDNLRLELLSMDGKPFPKTLVVERFVSVWYSNSIHTVTLEPGDAMVREVHLTSDQPMLGVHYANFPPMKAGDRHVIRMRATFESGQQKYDLRFHRRLSVSVSSLGYGTTGFPRLWVGHIVSNTDDYEVEQYTP